MSVLDVTARGIASKALAKLEDSLDYAIPQSMGARGDGGDDTSALLAFVATDKPKRIGTGIFATTAPLVIDDGRSLVGTGTSSVMTALDDFPATLDLPYNDTGRGIATIPAPVIVRSSTTGISNRDGVGDLAIDGAGTAATCLYVGQAADVPIQGLQLYRAKGAALVYDGAQNRGAAHCTITASGKGLQLLNSTFNCAFDAVDITEVETFLEMVPAPEYPNFGFFAGANAPRDVTFRDFIWERLTGAPVNPVYCESCHQLGFENAEMAFLGGDAERSNLSAFNLFHDCFRLEQRNIKMQGGFDDFPAGMSIVRVSGDVSDQHAYDRNFFLGWNQNGPPIRSIFRFDADGDFIVKEPRIVSTKYHKLIEAIDPQRVTYIPWRKQGPWSSRPNATDWLEAASEFTVVDGITLHPLKKSGAPAQSASLTADASTGQTKLTVSKTFAQNAVAGDQVCLSLDDGTFHISTVAGAAAPHADAPYTDATQGYVTVSAPLPSPAASGAKIELAGRWYRGNGLHYFGPVTYAQGDTTPPVYGVESLTLTNSAPTAISRFRYGQVGQRLTVFAADANTTILNSYYIVTRTGAPLTLAPNQAEEFYFANDFKWRQQAAQ